MPFSIALQNGALEVMDLTADPTAPVEVGYVHTPGNGVNVNVDGSSGNIYFSNDKAGREVY